MPGLESGSNTSMFYSFDYSLAHFISLSSETDYPYAYALTLSPLPSPAAHRTSRIKVPTRHNSGTSWSGWNRTSRRPPAHEALRVLGSSVQLVTPPLSPPHKPPLATRRGRRHAKHPWSSGKISACHAGDPGSIPGGCIFFLEISYVVFVMCIQQCLRIGRSTRRTPSTSISPLATPSTSRTPSKVKRRRARVGVGVDGGVEVCRTG